MIDSKDVLSNATSLSFKEYSVTFTHFKASTEFEITSTYFTNTNNKGIHEITPFDFVVCFRFQKLLIGTCPAVFPICSFPVDIVSSRKYIFSCIANV